MLKRWLSCTEVTAICLGPLNGEMIGAGAPMSAQSMGEVLAQAVDIASPAAPARARVCPCGNAYLARRTLGSACLCRQCGRERTRGCQMWECGACERRLCPMCKETRPHWKGGPVDSPSDGHTDGQGNGTPAVLPDVLLDELTLGQVLARIQDRAGLDMPLLVPNGARKRLGRLGRDLLSELLADMDAKAPEAKLRVSVGKLQHMYAAVLMRGSRDVHDSVPAAEADPITAPDQWKEIRARLQLAEAGRWKALFGPLAGQVAVEQSDWVSAALHGPESSAAAHAKRKLAAASKVKGGCAQC